MTDPVVESKINALKQEHEEVATEVRALLGRLAADDLKRASDNPGWKCQAVAAHMSKATDSFISYSQRVRDGKNISIPGGRFAGDLLNKAGAFLSRNMGAQDMLSSYERGSQKFDEELDKSRESDWERTVTVLGETRDLEGWFRSFIDHDREHLAELKPVANLTANQSQT